MRALPATIAVETRAGDATASLCVSRSNQHQTKLRFPRATWLAAASDYEPQDWSALCRAGFVQCGLTLSRCSTFMISYLARASVRVLSPHPHWLGFSSLTSHRPASRPLPHRGVGQHSPERAFTRCAGAFHSVRYRACKPSARHSLTVEQFSQCIADRVHVRRRLSNSASSAGSINASNGCQIIGKVCQNGGPRDNRNSLH